MLKDKKVLVIDDNAPFRRWICVVLEHQMNCQHLIQAGTADDAMKMINEQISEGSIDIILCDWEMPGMNGDELLYKIRENPTTKDVKFIMLTGRRDKDSAIAAIQMGANDYIVKPVSTAILIQKIRNLFNEPGRKLMTPFDSKVKIVFKTLNKYVGKLYEITCASCLVRSPVFTHATIGVYENVELEFLHKEGKVRLKAEIIRIEVDIEDDPSNQFIMVAFIFDAIDDENEEALKKLVADLKNIEQGA